MVPPTTSLHINHAQHNTPALFKLAQVLQYVDFCIVVQIGPSLERAVKLTRQLRKQLHFNALPPTLLFPYWCDSPSSVPSRGGSFPYTGLALTRRLEYLRDPTARSDARSVRECVADSCAPPSGPPNPARYPQWKCNALFGY